MNNLSWKEAIIQILKEAGKPLHYTEISSRILDAKLRTRVGATPAATVNAQISTSIKREGTASPFVRVEEGRYALRELLETPQNTQSDAEYQIITSFGMFWRRSEVDLSKPSAALWGIAEPGSKPVDFSDQRGIYILYDGREAIYIGRSHDRGLGQRLYEHTRDRLAARWDRFSWFGLRPVEDDAKLGDLPQQYAAHSIIPALESILIEALEPRQNRKRGDGFEAIEYLQKTDEKLEKRRLKKALESLVDAGS